MGEPRPLDGVAVIGLACRFPGAPDAERFWSNLVGGVESRQTFTDEELLAEGVPPDVLRNPAYVKAGPVLDDIELFDASFFGFNARDAELTDPQHRLFLELAWEAFENAAYDPEDCKDRVGVYAGARFSTYWVPLLRDRHFALDPEALQAGIGNEKDYLATQVSYKLDLRGPSIGVQTACSTSLVAVCQAYQALLTYQCDMALAGGASVRVPQKAGYLYRPGGIASPDGHCRAFDAQAAGTMFGSGVGVVLLKRLEDAVADRDFIHAVIRGAAVNNDGAAKVSYTAPSVDGQSRVIAAAQAIAGIEPETITYIETPGTGTPLGDSIEIAALEHVFRTRTAKKGFCAVGSVKTNIGHLDVAAGIAGFIKTVLAVRHGRIPPSLHFTEPNPQIPFADSSFFVPTSATPWRTEGLPRRAGVSSFGIGGTNAHVVVEEAPPGEPSGTAKPWQVLTLSARTAAALDATARNLATHLRLYPDLDLADVAFTLQVGRRAFRHRFVVLCRDREEAIAELEGASAQRVLAGVAERRDPPVAFLFSGRGVRLVERGRDLYHREEVFRHELGRCATILRPWLGWDLLSVFDPATVPAALERSLEETGTAPVARFAIEYSLARLWGSWGVIPSALAGCGIGEYLAACLAGVFSLEDGLALVAARSRVPQAGLRSIPLSPPRVPLLSSVTGTWMTAEQATDMAYWASQPQQIARLATDLGEVLARDAQVLLEVTIEDPESELASLGRLWLAGVKMDWGAFHAGERRRRVPLPTYPFERQRYWLDDAAPGVADAIGEPRRRGTTSAGHPRPELRVPYREPRSATERAVCEIWQRLLRVEPIGIDDDFLELGGHSLLGIHLMAELRSTLQVELPAGEIFRAPTVGGLAARVDEERCGPAAGGASAVLRPRAHDGDIPLSYAQERQWFLAQLEPDSPTYNQPAALRIEGPLVTVALAASLDEIERRHEAFRTTFHAVDRRPVQRIALPRPRPLPMIDLVALPPQRREMEAEQLAAEDAQRLFDLTRGSLLRVTLVRLATDAHVVLFNAHHIVCDQWSSGIVLRELEVLYGACLAGLPSPFSDLPLQYADFALWQRERLRGAALAPEMEYWRRRLGGRLPCLELTEGRARPARPTARGARHLFALSPDRSNRLEAFCRAEGATPFMSLLTAFKVVLHRWSGEVDLVVGTPVAGRDRAELEQMVGYFINALALRTDLSGDPTYRELVGRVREVTLGAYAHQELPFEKLVEELQPERRPGYHPIFQVVFNFQNAPAEPARLPGLAVRPLPVSRRASKYDLTLYMWHEPDRLAGAIEYKTDLFTPLEIVRLGEDLETVLACGIDAPGERLSELVHRLSTREAQESRQRQVEVHDSNLRRLRSIRRRPVSVAPLASNGAEEHEAERA